MFDIKTTTELKKLAEAYLNECPYLIFSKDKAKEFTPEFKELLERSTEEHKAVLDYLKDK